MPDPEFPGTMPPDRAHSVTSLGLRLNVLEWGDPAAPPVLLCHGLWDHARSFGVLAPLLARRFRVLAIDARGHGDSAWAAAYAWRTDVIDVLQVAQWIGRPLHLVGHSRGGGLVIDAAIALSETALRVVNIDGFGPPPEEASLPLSRQLAEFLDTRSKLSNPRGRRAYPSLDDLIERRKGQNPRLSREWLRYFVFHGARETPDGWLWKVDPHIGFGFGPWTPEWIPHLYARLQIPLLAIVGSEMDTWGPLPRPLRSERLARVRQLEELTIRSAGHFVHMEQPQATADAILSFLA